MWYVPRPDSLAVLHNRKARQSLRRYFAVMENKLPARFQLCKRVGVRVNLSAGEKELWEAHEVGLKEFRSLLSRIDEEKVSLESLAFPEVSLLDLKAELAMRVLKSCHFCERRCAVDRTAFEKGWCKVGEKAKLSSEFMHHGEEPELVPSYTIFFSGCTFSCQFCQNWDISQFPEAGVEVSPKDLAKLAEGARRDGARNVNWVGGEPTPNLHIILEALNLCKANIPSVWNSNMYMSPEAMKLLFGTQDVYLADFKYGNNKCGLRYSKVPKYFDVVARNHRLAFADAELIIRHLVMPANLDCCTRPIFKWIVENLGKTVRVNIMDQYRPCYKIECYDEVNRHLTAEEFSKSVKIAEEVGLENFIT
ncbi:MAG: radical SAM protein [Candidatus Hadarchaeota archaeon]